MMTKSSSVNLETAPRVFNQPHSYNVVCIINCSRINVNSLPGDHDYCRFNLCFLADQITVIGNEI